MKIWHQFGSEHSMNLVMIGSFKNVSDAQVAKDLIEALIDEVSGEPDTFDDDPKEVRFSPKMLDFLLKSNLMTVGAAELDQFKYDFRVEMTDNKVVLTTDESEVSAFLKVMLEKGAKVEVYSAHDYPDPANE